jgi:hypothetical protein
MMSSFVVVVVFLLLCFSALDIIIKSRPAPGTPPTAPEPRKLHDDVEPKREPKVSPSSD